MAGGFTVYGGYRRQRGGGFFGSFRTMAKPWGRALAKGVVNFANTVGVKQIAKKVAEKGAEVAAGVAMDALQGRNLGESIKERTREAAFQAIAGPTSQPQRKRKLVQPTPQSQKKRKLKQKSKVLQSSKRPASAKTQPPFKKRRISRAALNRRDLF